MKNKNKKFLSRYWYKNYLSDSGYCSLCGNSGILDTTNAKSFLGEPVGRLNFCFCPNGRNMRKSGETPERIVEIREQSPSFNFLFHNPSCDTPV